MNKFIRKKGEKIVNKWETRFLNGAAIALAIVLHIIIETALEKATEKK